MPGERAAAPPGPAGTAGAAAGGRSPLPGRLRRAWRRHGARGFGRRALSLLAGALYLREEHLWYRLDLDRPAEEVAARVSGLRLVRLAEEDPELLERALLDPREVRRRRAAGAELWIVLDGPEPVFTTWVFRGATPVLAARGGWLALPPGLACHEDAVTRPALRGCGIASAAWAAIAAQGAREGLRHVVSKSETANASSRGAHERAGFREFARMRLLRVGPYRRVTVESTGAPPPGLALREQLERRTPPPAASGARPAGPLALALPGPPLADEAAADAPLTRERAARAVGRARASLAPPGPGA